MLWKYLAKTPACLKINIFSIPRAWRWWWSAPAVGSSVGPTDSDGPVEGAERGVQLGEGNTEKKGGE